MTRIRLSVERGSRKVIERNLDTTGLVEMSSLTVSVCMPPSSAGYKNAEFGSGTQKTPLELARIWHMYAIETTPPSVPVTPTGICIYQSLVSTVLRSKLAVLIPMLQKRSSLIRLLKNGVMFVAVVAHRAAWVLWGQTCDIQLLGRRYEKKGLMPPIQRTEPFNDVPPANDCSRCSLAWCCRARTKAAPGLVKRWMVVNWKAAFSLFGTRMATNEIVEDRMVWSPYSPQSQPENPQICHSDGRISIKHPSYKIRDSGMFKERFCLHALRTRFSNSCKYSCKKMQKACFDFGNDRGRDRERCKRFARARASRGKPCSASPRGVHIQTLNHAWNWQR